MKKKQSENRQELIGTAYEKEANLLKRKPVCDESFKLEFFDELPIHEIAGKGSSHFTNRQLRMRMLRAGGELFRRADNGDTDAASELTVLARNLANELNLLAKGQPRIIRPIAKSFDEWPIVLSLIDKKKDAESWYGFFKETLKLGADSFYYTDRRKKIDLTDNTWNRLTDASSQIFTMNAPAARLSLVFAKRRNGPS